MNLPKINLPRQAFRADRRVSRRQIPRRMKKAAVFLLFVLLIASSAGAAEFVEGRIRLVLNENTGRFSLYYMADIAREEYVPFFADGDPRTSFLAIQVNDRNYRLGDSSAFKTSLGTSLGTILGTIRGTSRDESGMNPSLVFESPALRITEEFSFVKTSGSYLTNGVKITVTITNKGRQQIQAGLRFLIDTSLGEDGVPFSTDKREIRSEAVIAADSEDSFWVSGSGRLGFMGSVSGSGITRPDLIHFANWKRLNDVSWKTPFYQGRNFNLLPYSIGDSAVCYYYEPAAVNAGEARIITLVLASEDESGFSGNFAEETNEMSRLVGISARKETPSNDTMQADLVILRDLAAMLDEYIKSGASVSEEELAAIELVMSRLKAKYGL
ncbi:MAG: hypothetical protein LBP69_07255 [Treponema sp.]|jgi:hypothetical protein|nr:hypothetical protein [Treponema sp.]